MCQLLHIGELNDLPEIIQLMQHVAETEAQGFLYHNLCGLAPLALKDDREVSDLLALDLTQ